MRAVKVNVEDIECSTNVGLDCADSTSDDIDDYDDRCIGDDVSDCFGNVLDEDRRYCDGNNVGSVVG